MEDHWFPDNTSPSQSNCISSKCVFSQDHSVPYIVVTELSVSWTNDPERLTLSNISFTINKVNNNYYYHYYYYYYYYYYFLFYPNCVQLKPVVLQCPTLIV